MTKPAAGISRSQAYLRALQGLMIRDERGKVVPLRLSDSQKILWRYVAPKLDARERLWFICLKGRQVYVTTFFEALIFLRTIERANTNSLVIAQDLDSTAAIFDMVKRFYDYLPLPKLVPPRVKEIVLPLPGGPSRFKVVSAGVASKGRGTTQTCIHASEVAYWKHPETLVGLSQTMPDVEDTIWVLESTANGVSGQGEMFYRQWKAAVDGRSRFTPVFIPWFLMPKYREDPPVPEDEWDEEERTLVKVFGDLGLDGRSLRWRRYAIESKCSGSVDIFHQEYPSTPDEAFVASGVPAFDPLAILAQQPNIRPPELRLDAHGDTLVEDGNGPIHVWVKPKTGHSYAIGVDTSFVFREGNQSGDYACAQVLDMDDLEQVAVVHGPINAWDMSRIVAALGKWYHNAIVNVEVQSTGLAVQDYLMRVHHYSRLHPWRGRPDRYQRSSQVHLWGWVTNVYSRPLLIEAGRRAINTRLITLHDASTLDEIRHFSRQDTGKYEAEAGHDDRVLALLLALRTREENYVRSLGTVHSPEADAPRLPEPVVPAYESDHHGHRRLTRILREKAAQAVKTWMQL